MIRRLICRFSGHQWERYPVAWINNVPSEAYVEECSRCLRWRMPRA